MKKNIAIASLAIFFMLFGNLMLLGVIFLPEGTEKFFLSFAPDLYYNDLTETGLDVFRVLLGIIGSLIFAVGALMYPLSKNYNVNSRNWILVGTIGWAVGDSVISYLGGFTINVISNALFILLILITIFFLAGHPETE